MIDSDLSEGQKPRKIIAEEYGLSLGAIGRHFDHRRRQHAYSTALAASRRTHADRHSPEARTHRALDVLLSGTSIASELRSIKARADRLAATAESSGDPDVAIKALREMTRIIELQARLALEAQAGRASDVSTHPIFLEVMSIIVQALQAYPEAASAVIATVKARLGIDVHPDVSA